MSEELKKELEQAEEESSAGMELFLQELDDRIKRALTDMGFTKLTPIQESAIPALLAGEDIIGQAQTGTGKTAAFGIPLIQKVDPELRKLQAVVLCPTRELAIQAALELRKIAKYMEGLRVLPVYGGQDISRQIKALPGVQIVVGTPGRIMDHMRRHTIKLDEVSMAVLDEADEMLNMGFREDMEVILGEIPGEHQTALFSATMPGPILEIAGRFQKEARHIRVAAKELTIPLVTQKYYLVKNEDKDAATVRLLEYYQPKLCLIFCNTKAKVDELSEVLKKRDFQAEGLHGDLIQHQRDVVMGRFRSGVTNILIATDVAARGIDVENVEIVINYDIPQDIEYYVHRIGRTGRAGKTGQACTFVNAREMYRIREIERVCKTTLEEKKLPDPSKVLRVKASGFLDSAWAMHEDEDVELMKVYLRRKLEKEECDILDLAACMLRQQIGGKDEEIPEDKPQPKKKRFGLGGFGEDRKFGRKYSRIDRSGRAQEEGRDGERRWSRKDRNTAEEGRDGERRWGRKDRNTAEESRDGERRRGRKDRNPAEEGRDGEYRRGRKDRNPMEGAGEGSLRKKKDHGAHGDFAEIEKHMAKKEKKTGDGRVKDARRVKDVDKSGKPRKFK